MSSFFALHRPMSVISDIPPVATTDAFDSIFKPRARHGRRSLANNIQTLQSGIANVEAALRAHGQKAPEDAVDDVFHLDGPPQFSLEQIMAQCVSFEPPPPPVPLDQVEEIDSFSQAPESAPVEALKQRSWSTAVVVTESTDAAGNRTYSTSTTPMVEIRVPAADRSQGSGEIEIRQPFLERMRERQITHMRYRDGQGRPDMMAISVKRQRKLKMKKHKYKKLMKRTRLLRRKLDRL